MGCSRKNGQSLDSDRYPAKPRTALLCSKHLHCAADQLARTTYRDLGLDIAAVISNHTDAQPLAAAFGLPFHHVGVGDGANARAEQEAQLAELTRQGRDLETVVLARAVRAHVEHRVLTFGNRTVVFS